MHALTRSLPLLVAAVLPAQRDLLDRLPPDADAHGIVAAFDPALLAVPTLTPVQLLGEGDPQGLAPIGTHLWVARGGRLYRTAWPGGDVTAELDAPSDLRALAANERFLFGLLADAIAVLDPLAGREVRRIPWRGDGEPVGLACGAADLFVLAERTVWRVDPGDGKAEEVGRVQGRPRWLAHDGKNLLVGSGFGFEALPAESQPGHAAHWSAEVQPAAATWIDGRLLLLGRCWSGRQAVDVVGFVAPEPRREKLSLKVFEERAGACCWQVGPTRCNSLADVEQLLQRHLRKRGRGDRDGGGEPQPMQIAIEPYPGTKVADAIRAWDLAKRVGFTDIAAPALEAVARRRPPR